MADVTVTITGLDQLQRTLEQMPREVARKAIRGALKDGAEMVRQRIVSGAPRRTGFLSAHFNTRFRLRGDELAGSAFVGPASKVYYPGMGDKSRGTATGRNPQKGGALPVASVARFVEYGTSRMPAHPFMRPAFEGSKDTILNMIVSSIQDAIANFRSR